MNMDFPNNSNRFKETSAETNNEEKKIEKIVTGNVKTKKKSGLVKFFRGFISDDIKDIKTYLFTDVVVPTIKKSIWDVVDMVLYGGKSSRSRNYGGSRVSYRDYYDEPKRTATRVVASYSYEDVILETRGEAEEVLDQLVALIDRYQTVSVADLYDLVGIAKDYTSNKYGWTNLATADVVRVRDGYMLKLPRPVPIK